MLFIPVFQQVRRYAVLLAVSLIIAGCGGGSSTGSGSGGETGGTQNPGNGGTLTLLSDLLDRLRTDTAGTLLEESMGQGWPVETDQGFVVVDEAPFKSQVAGDFDAFAGTPMTADSGFAYAVIGLSPGDSYKFTDGVTFEADPWARAYGYDAFGETSLFRPSGAHLERFKVMSSPALPDRFIHVWVPAETVTHLLYAQDGQNLFDPGAIFGGWDLQSAAPAGMMIVGIENSAERLSEYTHVQDDVGGGLIGGNASAYAAYLQSTVRPLIADKYGEPAKIGILGSSLGGVVSLYVASQYPDEFDFVASMSGTVGWGSIGSGITNQTIIQLYASGTKPGFSIYLDSGGTGTCQDSDGDGTDDDGTASDNMCENIQFRDSLIGLGYVLDTDLWYWWESGAAHNEAAWAARVFRPLGFFSNM